MSDLGFLILAISTATSMGWLTMLLLRGGGGFLLSYLSVVLFLMFLTVTLVVWS